jgi:hypothetical protein
MKMPDDRVVDFKEVHADGEDWEAFARDFLVALGFTIESPPDRGADGGKDILVLEQLQGRVSSYGFRWLVSCKHFAHSGRAVSEIDEPNILERMRDFRADGFMGFYSTLPTAALNTRLRSLRNNAEIRDYKIFDARLIENQLLQIGYSQLMMQFLPDSYRRARPRHLLLSEYVPLKCHTCGIDLIEELDRKEYSALVGFGRRPNDGDGPTHIEEVYWACKGPCDEAIERRLHQKGLVAGWEDISDLVIPVWYLRWFLTIMNRMRDGRDVYSDDAYDNEKQFLIALGQKVFRDLTAEDRARLGELFELSELFGG